MRRFLPELIALPLLPLLIAQGRRTRRITPRLPEAAHPSFGLAGSTFGSSPLALLALGESPVAGVGVTTHEEAITGQLAKALAAHLQRPVRWRACRKNGATVRDAIERIVPEILPEPVDLALVAFGVNDTSAFRPVGRWRADLLEILTALDERCAPRQIILAGVPPVAHFPVLPQPLRWVLGLKASALDAAAREISLNLPHVLHVPLALNPWDETLMASDGYHPSAKGCAACAELLAAAYVATLNGTG